VEEFYRQALQAGASMAEARRMSLYDWSLLTQAHQRNALRRDQRILLMLNAWTKPGKQVTLDDLHGGSPDSPQAPDELSAFKRRVMQEKDIKRDLTTNRL